jgi:hypothetical protein
MAKFAPRKFGAASARHVFVVCCTGALLNFLRAPSSAHDVPPSASWDAFFQEAVFLILLK